MSTSSPQDLVREAICILDGTRDENGKLPSRTLNNYLSLRHALDFGDCQDWTILSLAKSVIFAQMRDDM